MYASSFNTELPLNQFYQQGYLFKYARDYKLCAYERSSKRLLQEFNQLEQDKSPGSRYRAYLKLCWNRNLNVIKRSADQKYYQTYNANNLDGGKFREFKILDHTIFHNEALQKIIHTNLEFIRQDQNLAKEDHLTLGIHFVRYAASEGEASYSSPIWLHIDDEPLVFLHLMQVSDNLIGGDSIIAEKKGAIKNVFRLKNFMDTMVLNRNARHAVTPMGSTKGLATRDIILFTVEPTEKQEGY